MASHASCRDQGDLVVHLPGLPPDERAQMLTALLATTDVSSGRWHTYQHELRPEPSADHARGLTPLYPVGEWDFVH